MADVLLIEPRTGESDVVYAPLGLLALGAYLETEFSVAILDQRLYTHTEFDQVLSEELQKHPTLVGVTAITGRQITYGLEISSFIKQTNPSIPIAWGGVHPTFIAEITLANEFIDYVVRYEGEATLLELTQALRDGRTDLENILGLCFKRDGQSVLNAARPQLDMQKLPQSAWHLIDVPRYVDGLSAAESDRPIDVATARGCPFRCAFCYEIDWSGRMYRSRSSDQVIEELRMLADQFGTNHIIIHDDLAIVNKQSKERMLRILSGMNEDGYSTRFTFTYRVDQLCRDVPFAEEMVKHGWYEMRAGVESGSQRILDLMQKDLTIEDILESARITRALGIHVQYSFLLGYPGETEDDRRQTVDLCFRLMELNSESRVLPFNIYTPYPGSPQYDDTVKAGFVEPTTLEEWGNYSLQNVNIPWLTNAAKYENMATLSKFAFYSGSTNKVFKGLLSSDLRTKTKIRRLGGWALRGYARRRLKHLPGLLPYEYRFIEPWLLGNR